MFASGLHGGLDDKTAPVAHQGETKRETERERGREGERESTLFKRETEHLYLRQPIHGIGQRGDSHVDGVKMKH